MPDLPTLTVTVAQRDRLLAAFGDDESYRRWLRGALRQHVLADEQARMQAAALADQRVALSALADELNL